MPNPFDHLKSAMTNIVTQTMGYDAVWVDAMNSNAVLGTARVLFKHPTRTDNVQEFEFDFDFYTMEYKESEFIGLAALAANPRNKATIIIEGALFRVRKVTKKYDGGVYIAVLDKPE